MSLGKTLVAVSLVLAGCSNKSSHNGCVQGLACGDGGLGSDGGGSGTTISKLIPIEADVDILFVVDNSASTAEKQALFAQNFPNFVAALDAFPGGRPSLHVGVVSTTVGTGSTVNFGPGCPTTAPNDDGLLQNTPRITGCTPPNGRFISDIKNATGQRTCNYGTGSCSSSDLSAVFSCIAELGTTGCGFEAPLEAMKRALDGSRPENAGFVRPSAFLAVVLLTDEDDCSVKDPAIFSLTNVGPGDFRCQPLFAYQCDQAISATVGGTYTNCKTLTGMYLQDPSSYLGFLAMVKDPALLVVSAIAGADDAGNPPPSTGATITTGAITVPFMQSLALEPSCMTTINGATAVARPGLRLSDFVSQLGFHASFHSICQSDYSAALTGIGQQIATAMSPCLQGAIDTTDVDASNPGLQPACTVTDIQNFGTANQVTADLPVCPMTAIDQPAASPRPCWWVKSNPTTCPTTTSQTNLELHVERSAPPPTGTITKVTCKTN